MSKFEVPEVLSRGRIQDEKYEVLYGAVLKHRKHLSKAEDDLMVAKDLATVLERSLGETHDDHCMTAATVVKQIAKRLDRARSCLDRHGRRHSNLFVAYFDLKAEGGAS